MLKSASRMVFRNLLKTKLYSLISILGLAIGMGVFIIGLFYLNHEWSYDKGFTGYENIYRIETKFPKGNALTLPLPVADIFQKKYAAITTLTKFMEWSLNPPPFKSGDEKQSIYINHYYYTDTAFFKVFDFPFIYGKSQDAFSYPNAIILSKQTSRRLFNNHNPVGKKIEEGNGGIYIVTGVFDDTQFPSHLSIDAVVRLESPTDQDLWVGGNYLTYVKINSNSSVGELKNNLTFTYQKEWYAHYNETPGKTGTGKSSAPSIELRRLKDIHLHSHTDQEITKSGNTTMVWLIACLVSFMLLVSAINFTNFMIAMAPSRVKEIAIRRVLGSSKAAIYRQLYFEIFIRCFIALCIASIIVISALPVISDMLSFQVLLSGKHALKIIVQLLILLTGIVLLTGTYPVLYISFFRAISILKGNFMHSTKGNTVRNVLLVVQFSITSVFIIGFLVISAQVTFMRNKDLGFDATHVLAINPGQFFTTINKYGIIRNELSNIPGVKNISYASTAGGYNEKTVCRVISNGVKIDAQDICIDTGYLTLMNARFISGRNFSKQLNDSLNAIVINRQLADELGIKSVDHFTQVKFWGENTTVVGIVENMNFYGFEDKTAPMVFTLKRFTLAPYVLLGVTGKDISSTLHAIEKVWKDIEPGYPLRYQFMDRSFQQLYNSYENLDRIFRLFTICALLIAFIGLFAIVATVTMQRSKEIAIRKILGATVPGILKLLNRNFIILSFIANLLAWPIAYFLARQWLNNFAYRVELPVAPFVIAATVSITLTIFTVCAQAYKAASGKQVEMLKQE